MIPINTPDGLFHAGNPALAIPGTVITAEWLNAVQDDLINIAGTVRKVSAAYPLVNGDNILLCDTTAAGFTVTLPALSGLGALKQFTVKNLPGGIDNIALVTADAKNIDGQLQLDLAPGDRARLCHDGTNWFTI